MLAGGFRNDKKTLYNYLLKRLDEYGDNQAYCIRERGAEKYRNVSTSEFLNRIFRVGTYLNKSGYCHSKIAILSEDSYEWIVSFFAITTANCCAVPLENNANVKILKEMLEYTDCELLIYSEALRDVAEELSQSLGIHILCMDEYEDIVATTEIAEDYGQSINEEDLAVISFTSGTTSKRKGVMHNHYNLWHVIIAGQRLFGDSLRVMIPLPYYHMFAIGGILLAYSKGRTLLVSSMRYLPRDILEFKPDFLAIVPSMIESVFVLLQNNEDPMIICSGGGHMDLSWIERFAEINVRLMNSYGATECAPGIAVDYERHDGSFERVVNMEIRTTKDGELVLRAPNVMVGYYKMPEETARVLDDGWYHTGDLAHIIDDKYIFLEGRTNNLLVLSNGENIPAEAFEELLLDAGADEALVSSDNGTLKATVYSASISDKELKERVLEINRTLASARRFQIIDISSCPLEKTALGKIKR